MENQSHRTCAHHGAINRPNSIRATRQVLRENAEVAIVEVDFVSLDGARFVSSHDYDAESCARGDTLDAWVRFLCLEQRKIMYLDAKATLPVWSLFFNYDAQERFNCTGLFTLLNQLAKEMTALVGSKKKKKRKSFDLRKYVWIACQDQAVWQRLYTLNETYAYGWRVIVDAPYIETYLAYYLTPHCCIGSSLQPMLQERYLRFDFSRVSVVAIDCRCIAGLGEIESFVRASNIVEGSTLVLYVFERHEVRPITIRGYDVVMMYNYYCK